MKNYIKTVAKSAIEAKQYGLFFAVVQPHIQEVSESVPLMYYSLQKEFNAGSYDESFSDRLSVLLQYFTEEAPVIYNKKAFTLILQY